VPNSEILNKPIEELISEMSESGNRMSNVEQAKLAAHKIFNDKLNESLNSLEKSMDSNAKSSDKLARKVFWLNVVLTSATVAGSIIAFLSLTK
jgi:hypothetical protein